MTSLTYIDSHSVTDKQFTFFIHSTFRVRTARSFCWQFYSGFNHRRCGISFSFVPLKGWAWHSVIAMTTIDISFAFVSPELKNVPFVRRKESISCISSEFSEIDVWCDHSHVPHYRKFNAIFSVNWSSYKLLYWSDSLNWTFWPLILNE